MSESDDREKQILSVMRRVLTGIVKETATPPGMRHPLSEQCIGDIRQALVLISSRERELAAHESKARPRYPDQPRPGSQVITVDQITGKTKPKK